MGCPANNYIANYQIFSKVVDTTKPSRPIDVSAYIAASGLNNYSEASARILKQAGINPHQDYDKKRNLYPTTILYGSYTCEPGVAPLVGVTEYLADPRYPRSYGVQRSSSSSSTSGFV